MTAVILPKLGSPVIEIGLIATAFGGTCSLRASLGLGYKAPGSVGHSSLAFFDSNWRFRLYVLRIFCYTEEMIRQMLALKGNFGSSPIIGSGINTWQSLLNYGKYQYNT